MIAVHVSPYKKAQPVLALPRPRSLDKTPLVLRSNDCGKLSCKLVLAVVSYSIECDRSA